MRNLFLSLGIDLKEEKISKFNSFATHLKEVNEVMNLTTITADREMWIKHFLDSAIGKDFFEKGCNCLEVGSGGGFPSVPLKILRDDINFTLVESTGKKCEYLKGVGKLLGFDGFEVICERAEVLSKLSEHRERYLAVTARAVARLNTLCEYCLPFVKVGGVFIAYKGEAKDELKEAENAIKILGGKIKTIKEYDLPDGAGKRNLIVIEKIKNTPPQYPRGNGKERKKPL